VTSASRLDPVALERSFELAREQVADGTVPFAILAVATAEGLVRAEAFPGPRAPRVRLDTICLLASITKPVVATAILQLVAEGRVTLDDPIDRLLPGAVDPGRPPITIWHLLTHTSGIPDFDLENLLATRPDRRELLRRAGKADLRFAPGSRYEYVSSSFELLGAIVERVRGEALEATLRRTILRPLGMVDTTFAPSGRRSLRIAPLAAARGPDPAVGWEPRPTSLGEVRYFAGLSLAGAGLFATAGDLIRFGRAMLRGGELDGVRVLPRPFVELMTREQTVGGLGAAADPPAAEHYALGWGKPDPRTSPASPEAFGHGGLTCTRLWVDPRHDLVVVYLSGVLGLGHAPIDAALATVYAAIRDGRD
jgi:CubicO group peptidase (beta-lactamase class C family)